MLKWRVLQEEIKSASPLGGGGFGVDFHDRVK